MEMGMWNIADMILVIIFGVLGTKYPFSSLRCPIF